MSVDRPNFNINPIDVIRTVNESTVKRGLVLQAHQLFRMGQAISLEAERQGLDSLSGFVLSGGERVTIAFGKRETLLAVQISKEERLTDMLVIDSHDEQGNRRFIVGGTPSSYEVGRLMIQVCEEVLNVDLTPQPLYKSPKERGIKND